MATSFGAKMQKGSNTNSIKVCFSCLPLFR